MSNVIKFTKKWTEEEILDLNDAEFDVLLEEYKNHSQLKDLIAKYREVSENLFADLSRLSLRYNNTSGSTEKLENEMYYTIYSGTELGHIITEIARTISSL